MNNDQNQIQAVEEKEEEEISARAALKSIKEYLEHYFLPTIMCAGFAVGLPIGVQLALAHMG